MLELLLLLSPTAFRNEYGPELRRTWAVRRRNATALEILGLWLELIPDLLSTAIREHWDILRQDLRFAWRAFSSKPGFALTAIVIVALGIGANTAIFTAVDYSLLRPLPFAAPDRLVKVWEDARQASFSTSNLEPSPANYLDWKQLSHSFEGMAAYRGLSANLTGNGDPERLEGAAITAELLPVLGVQPVLGRSFTTEEDQAGGPKVVLLSHGLWVRRFGADPAVLGTVVRLDGVPHKVTGVMPPSFRFPDRDANCWTAMQFTPQERKERGNHYIHVIARLREGVPLPQALAEMRHIGTQLAAEYPKDNDKESISVVPLRDVVSVRWRMTLLTLMAASACVLLIACANLANLLLARAMTRRKELAVRSALGAGRERLLRQVLTESLLLSSAGGLLGILIAFWSLPLVRLLIPPTLPAGDDLRIDPRVLTFGLALSVLTGLVFGLLPARHAARQTAFDGLREGGRQGVGGRKGRLRDSLVVFEVAATAVLLICGGLLLRTLWTVRNVDPGFRPESVITLRTSLPMPKYERLAERERFYRHVLDETRALPGVTNAGYTSFMPLKLRGGIFPVRIDGKTGAGELHPPMAMFRMITPGYFQTLGIPLLAGRDVDLQDRVKAPLVAVVSRSFVRQYFDGASPLGHRIHIADEWRTIAGVVGDVRARGLENSQFPQVYIPYSQVDQGFTWFAPKDLAVRGSGDPMALIPALRRIIRAADPEQPISDIETLTGILDDETSGRRRQLWMLGLFAALAFGMAAVGLHGVLAFLVSQRSQELGVRMTLGATATQIVSLVLGHGMRLAGAGLIVGLAGGLVAAKGMERLLVGVTPFDWPTLAATAVLCLLGSFGACGLPAWRAARVDPLEAIRTD